MNKGKRVQPYFLLTAEKRAEYQSRVARLRSEIDSLTVSLSQAGREAGDDTLSSAAQEVSRQLDIARRRHAEAQFVLFHSWDAEVPTDPTQVGFDRIVTITQYDEKGDQIGGTLTVRVGEYGATDMKATPPVMSHDTEVINSIMGRKVGDSVTETIFGKLREIEVIDVRAPSEFVPQIVASAA